MEKIVNLKKKILLAMGVMVISMPVVASARDIQNFNNLLVPRYQGVNNTPKALKSANAGATILNLKEIDGGGSYALDGYLVNSSDEQRSEYAKGIMEHSRTAIANRSSAKANYYYRFINHNSISQNAYVSG